MTADDVKADLDSTAFVAENQIRILNSELAILASQKQYYREGMRDVETRAKKTRRLLQYWQAKLRKEARP